MFNKIHLEENRKKIRGVNMIRKNTSYEKTNLHCHSISALVIIILLIVIMTNTINVWADNDYISNKILDEQLEAGGIGNLKENLKDHTDPAVYELLPEYNPDRILEDAVRGQFRTGLSGLFQRIAEFLFKEIYTNINLMIKLLILAIFCAIIKNLQSSFLSEGVGELGFYVCYAVIVTILVISFNTAMNMGRDTIDSMVAFMQATVPLLMTLLVSSGNITSGGIFQPVLIMAVEVVATILKNVFIPLIFLSAVLSIVNNISNKFQISRLTSLLKGMCFWMLAFVLTVFVAIVGVQGSMGAVVDGVTSKTAKLAIGVIPVAGKYLADAAEAVVSCALLIKNAAGVAVMVGIVAICLVPVLKIVALILIYRFVGAIVEPISETRVTNCINDMAGSLSYIMAIVASVAIMFLMSTAAILSAGNIAAMIR